MLLRVQNGEVAAQPVAERLLHEFYAAREEMVGARNERQLLWLVRGSGDLDQVGGKRKLIVVSAEEEFRKSAGREGRVVDFAALNAGGQAEYRKSANVDRGLLDTTGL